MNANDLAIRDLRACYTDKGIVAGINHFRDRSGCGDCQYTGSYTCRHIKTGYGKQNTCLLPEADDSFGAGVQKSG